MRVHLIQQEEKMVDGQTYTALCGEKVENAQSVYLWDEMNVGSSWFMPPSSCPKCSAMMLDSHAPLYIFGIVDTRLLDKKKGVA